MVASVHCGDGVHEFALGDLASVFVADPPENTLEVLFVEIHVVLAHEPAEVVHIDEAPVGVVHYAL